jgi:starvation-inducible DNA-binding protein
MEKLFKQLSDAQASLFVLFHKTWIYHWNVTGPDFQQLHTLFGEQYESMFEELDRLTEHLRYLNMKPVSTLNRVVEVSYIEQAANSAQGINAKGMVKDLMQSNQTLINLLIDVHNTADRIESLGTTSILEDLMENHGKFVWMLRSISETARGSSSVEDIAPVSVEEPVTEEFESNEQLEQSNEINETPINTEE